MSVNKAQGQTFKIVGLYLDPPCFSHGQFYVGSSRVGVSKGLYIYTPDANRKMKNIVLKNALQ